MLASSACRVGTLAVVGILTLAACSQETPRAVAVLDTPLPDIAQSVLDQRGTIVQSTPVEGLDPTLADKLGEARTVVYRSVSAYDGQVSEVASTVYRPRGDAPAGGWPVISYGHPTTGLGQDCGPSLSPDLRGYAPTLAAIAEAGFVVTMTDFQGLGWPGDHPYLEPRTAGFNMIDAVRAVRNQYPDTSDKWMAVGGSQGGQAAWAANEYSADYGSGLNLVGSVSTSPAADITGFAEAARDETLTGAQTAFMPLIIDGLSVVHPDLEQSDYLRGAAAGELTGLTSCALPDTEKAALSTQLDAAQVQPASDEATDRLTEWLTEASLPQRRAPAPMLVINGSDDELILPAWVSKAVDAGCRIGDRIVHREMAGQGHADADAGDEMYQWMLERFSDKDAPNECP